MTYSKIISKSVFYLFAPSGAVRIVRMMEGRKQSPGQRCSPVATAEERAVKTYVARL